MVEDTTLADTTKVVALDAQDVTLPADEPLAQSDEEFSSDSTPSGEAECEKEAPTFSALGATTPSPRSVWSTLPRRQVSDAYGYGRIPAFWYTLNLPFNYLFEIHRFHKTVSKLAERTDTTTMNACASCLDPL